MSPVKSMKKVLILTESQIKSLMDNLRVERDEKILSEMKHQDQFKMILECLKLKFRCFKTF